MHAANENANTKATIGRYFLVSDGRTCDYSEDSDTGGACAHLAWLITPWLTPSAQLSESRTKPMARVEC